MKIPIKFNGPSYRSDPILISPEECINFYLRPIPPIDYANKKANYALIGTPGLELFYDSGETVGIRGSIAVGSYLYYVVDDQFCKLDSGGVSDTLGTLSSSIGHVNFSTNGLDITFVDSNNGYVWDLTALTLTQITDADFPNGYNIIFTDGYYLINKPGTGEIWRSDFNDGLSWSSLAFSTAGGNPDNVVAIELDGKDVWVIGEDTSVIWYNTGVGEFNFAPIPSSFIDKGSPSSYAHCSVNNAIYWLSKDDNGQGQVLQAIGRSPKVISTQPISSSLSTYDLSSAYMFGYQQDGHAFVVLTVPSAETTWVYDSTVGEWHQRSSLIAGDNKRWRIFTHSFFNRKHIVGDYATGKLYEMKTDVYDENGDDMVAVRITPISRDKQSSITVNQVSLLMETGVGIISGNDEDVNPQAMFSWSKDGGKSFSPEIDLSLGKIGSPTFPRVDQLGQGRNWCFKIRISASVKRVILGAYADVEEDHG